MKMRNFVLVVILLFVARGPAFAARQLDKTEIRQILQKLTDQPRKTWIPAGTIEATHQECELSGGYVIDSTIIVKYDGERFYWEINVDSHTKRTEPQGSLHDEPAPDNSNLNWSTRRVFTWDGERYIVYFRPGNHAIVTESPSDIPVTVNGPLTAGLIPWGHGMYTLENLLAAESSAEIDDQGRVHLTVSKTDAPEMVFVLDPAKAYAVLSCLMNYSGRSSTAKTYGDYELVSGKWVPTTIITERYDNGKQPSELLSYDYWDLTSIRVELPHPASFRAQYETDALVEFHSPITDKPLSYHYRSDADTDSLLQDRLAIASAHDKQAQNCATVAMRYVSAQLGRDVTDANLGELLNEPNEGTSLYELRQVAQELGFHCLAVKTDVQTLKNLNGCQVILHLPGPNHYVVLEHIDDEYVWIIDLDSNKFYYRIELDGFSLDWSGGTALLISNEPLTLEGNSTEISDSDLHRISGSAGGGFGNFSCTDLIQEYNIHFCSEPIFGLCGGRYRVWYNRCACESDPQGGSCTGTGIVGNISSPCIEDPYNPGSCTITGEWFPQYIRACQPCEP